MKKSILLNQPISAVIADMGHKDTLCIGDCGLPVPKGTPKIDLAVIKGIPEFLQVLDAVLTELCVEKVVIASEMQEINPALYKEIQARFGNIEIEEIPHEEFKRRESACKAVVRTGEYRSYANIILQSGVTF